MSFAPEKPLLQREAATEAEEQVKALSQLRQQVEKDAEEMDMNRGIDPDLMYHNWPFESQQHVPKQDVFVS